MNASIFIQVTAVILTAVTLYILFFVADRPAKTIFHSNPE